jgi:hypothetical protein
MNPQWHSYGITESALSLPDDISVVSKLEEICYITHQNDAIRAIDLGRTTPRQVTNAESILSKIPLAVTWLSPTDIYNASVYGTVGFKFPWNSFQQQNFYWIEAVEHAHKMALRILLSPDDDLDKRYVDSHGHSLLKSMDVTKFGQPIYFDGQDYLIKNEFDYEFVIPGGVSLKQDAILFFIEHNVRFCSISLYRNASNCTEKNLSESIRQVVCELLTSRNWAARLINEESAHDIARDFLNSLFSGAGIEWSKNETYTPQTERDVLVEGALVCIGAEHVSTGFDLLTLRNDTDAFLGQIVKIASERFGKRIGNIFEDAIQRKYESWQIKARTRQNKSARGKQLKH